MSRLCTLRIGDSNIALDHTADGFTFTHTDGFTNQTDTMHFTSENAAMMTLAAWIASDMTDLGELGPYRDAIPSHIRA